MLELRALRASAAPVPPWLAVVSSQTNSLPSAPIGGAGPEFLGAPSWLQIGD